MSFMCEACCEDYKHSELVMIGKYPYCQTCAKDTHACSRCQEIIDTETPIERDDEDGVFCKSCNERLDEIKAEESDTVMRYLRRI